MMAKRSPAEIAASLSSDDARTMLRFRGGGRTQDFTTEHDGFNPPTAQLVKIGLLKRCAYDGNFNQVCLTTMGLKVAAELGDKYARLALENPKKMTKRKTKKKATKKHRKNYAVTPTQLVPIIKRWAKAEKCDGDLVVMTGKKWSRDVVPTDADVMVCCRSKLLRAIRKQGDVMEDFSELLGEHGYSYVIKGDEIRVHGLGINPGKKVSKKLTAAQRAKLRGMGEEGLMFFEEGEEIYEAPTRAPKRRTDIPSGTRITRVPPGAAEGALPLSWNPKKKAAKRKTKKKTKKRAKNPRLDLPQKIGRWTLVKPTEGLGYQYYQRLSPRPPRRPEITYQTKRKGVEKWISPCDIMEVTIMSVDPEGRRRPTGHLYFYEKSGDMCRNKRGSPISSSFEIEGGTAMRDSKAKATQILGTITSWAETHAYLPRGQRPTGVLKVRSPWERDTDERDMHRFWQQLAKEARTLGYLETRNVSDVVKNPKKKAAKKSVKSVPSDKKTVALIKSYCQKKMAMLDAVGGAKPDLEKKAWKASEALGKVIDHLQSLNLKKGEAALLVTTSCELAVDIRVFAHKYGVSDAQLKKVIRGSEREIKAALKNPGGKNPILARGRPRPWIVPASKKAGEPHAISHIGAYTVELYNWRKTPVPLPKSVRPSPWMAKVFKGRRIARSIGDQGFIGGTSLKDAQRNVLREIQI